MAFTIRSVSLYAVYRVVVIIACAGSALTASVARGSEPIGLFPSPVTQVTFSEKGDLFSAGCFDGSVFVGITETGKKAFFTNVSGPMLSVVALTFFDDGGRLAVASSGLFGGALYSMNVNTEVAEKMGHLSEVHALALDRKRERLLVASQGNREVSVQAFSLYGGSPSFGRSTSAGRIHSVAFFSEEDEVYAVGARSVYRWSLKGRREDEYRLPGSTDVLCACSCQQTNQSFIGGADGLVQLVNWPARKDGGLKAFRGLDGEVSVVAVSADGNWLAAGGMGQTVVVWSTAKGAMARKIGPLKSQVRSIAFSPDSTMLLVGTGYVSQNASEKRGELYLANLRDK